MVSKETLIAYLLHQMPESERLDFAGECFADPDANEQLETAEAELLDAYVRGELPRTQRESVERYLLSSAVQREKLKFAAALQASIPKPGRPIPWLALSAAAILILLAGLTLFVAGQNRELRAELEQERNQAKPIRGGFYAATLRPSRRGPSGNATLTLPKQTTLLRLNLELNEGDDRSTYEAKITRGASVLWKQEPLKKENREGAPTVTLWLPANLLEPGNYTISLQSAGTPVAYYPLTIQSQPEP
jgi:hypothetical protein